MDFKFKLLTRFTKISILNIIIVFMLFQNLTAQWEWQNPMPNGNDLHGVNMLSEDKVVIVGGAGIVMRTSNSGNFWESNYSVENVYWKFNDVSFVDENTGWAVGEGDVHDDIMVIVKTTDGGNSWVRLNTGVSTPQIPNSVFFVNHDTGYVAGENGKFLKTTNGGNTWIDKEVWGGVVSPINGMYFINSNVGWVVSQSAELGFAFKTTDGGDTWSLDFLDGLTMFRTIFMVDNQYGFIGGMGVYRTTNGGLNWVRTPATPGGSVRDMYFFDANTGLTVGADYIWRTTNGGNTWTMVYPGQTNVELYSVSFIDDLNGFVSGARGMILKTTDGGLTWNELTNIYINIIRLDDVHFINSNTGIVVGDDGGKIYRTSDSGTTWSLIESGITPVLRAVDFFDDNIGVAVGRYGIIRRTTDAGISWSNPQVNQATEQLFGLHILDDEFACAVGENTIVTTTDGGVNWFAQSYTYPDWVMGVHFLNRQKGFAVGINGKIYRTINGGSNWTLVSTITPQNILRRVAFADDLNGIAVGDLGTVARTTDGGETWSKIQLSKPYLNSFFAVSFLDNNTGFISGDGGIILKTTNAGASWERQESPTMHRVLGMQYISENEAAMVGAFGQILRKSPTLVAHFSVNKSEIIFENIPVGVTKSDSLQVYNTGNALLEIYNVESSNPLFSINPTSASVLANDSLKFIVQVLSDSIGLYVGDLIFTHNGPTSPDTVKVSADIITGNVTGNEELLPKEFMMHQNYPNPFNPETVIKFDLPKSAKVKIEVFNMLGQLVDVLIDAKLEAGYHNVNWNAKRISSGMYFFRFTVDNRLTLVKKGMLLK